LELNRQLSQIHNESSGPSQTINAVDIDINTVSKQQKSNNDHTLTENEFEEEDSNDYESK